MRKRKRELHITWMENFVDHSCGSNAFQGYFDDAKESRAKQIPKIQESRFKNSRIKFQESRFKNNQDQDSRLKIQESREDSIKISTKKVFQNIE